MKKIILTLAIQLFLSLYFIDASAQYFCFFVDNQSGETFYELKIRPSGTTTFSADLLSEDFIESGKHFWARTGTTKKILWDIQITREDGSPLLFSWKGTNGVNYSNKKYITLNVRDLHTLVIGSDDGILNFAIYNNDEFDYGDPCDN